MAEQTAQSATEQVGNQQSQQSKADKQAFKQAQTAMQTVQARAIKPDNAIDKASLAVFLTYTKNVDRQLRDEDKITREDRKMLADHVQALRNFVNTDEAKQSIQQSLADAGKRVADVVDTDAIYAAILLGILKGRDLNERIDTTEDETRKATLQAAKQEASQPEFKVAASMKSGRYNASEAGKPEVRGAMRGIAETLQNPDDVAEIVEQAGKICEAANTLLGDKVWGQFVAVGDDKRPIPAWVFGAAALGLYESSGQQKTRLANAEAK